MSPRKPSTGVISTKDNSIPDKRTKVTKSCTSSRTKSSTPVRKYRNGLLNAEISIRSEAMQIARRNAKDSPLLRLPAEIRNKIWQFALGYHHIKVYNKNADRGYSRIKDIKLSYDAYALHDMPCTDSFAEPAFALPLACRQIYVEAAAMIYTLNLFSFRDSRIMDRFIKNRVLGQRRLIHFIGVPFSYFWHYRAGSRKNFRQTFPTLLCICMHTRIAACLYPELWRTDENAAKWMVQEFVNTGEGVDIEILWD